MSDDQKRQGYVEDILGNLLSNIPTSYNVDSGDTNFYKLLRAASQELADSQLSIDQVRDNVYLNTATSKDGIISNPGGSIYNNFGVFVKLQKRAEWSEEKYRSLISGVTNALLGGPNKENLLKAFKLFTQFEVKVFELYKDRDLVDPGVYAGHNPKYTFLLQIDKKIEDTTDSSNIATDANYIINIIKPAHTIGIYVVNLKGDEDYRHYYGVDKKILELSREIKSRKIDERIDEWLSQNLNQLINNYSIQNNVSISVATDKIYEQNFGKTKIQYDADLLAKTNALENEYIESFSITPVSATPLSATPKTNTPAPLNKNDFLIPVFGKYHFSKIAVTKLRGSIDLSHLNVIRENYYLSYIQNINSTRLNVIINARKEALIKTHILVGGSRGDFTDAQWDEIAVKSLKDEIFKNKVIDSFSTTDSISVPVTGDEKLFEISFTEAKTFENQLSAAFDKAPHYVGMDKIIVDGNNNYRENQYGWKSISHHRSFQTSISFTKSKIGGTDLIGPLHILSDQNHQEFRAKYEENYLQHKNTFVLNTSLISGSSVLSHPEMDDLEEMAAALQESFAIPKATLGIEPGVLEDKYVMGPSIMRLQTNNLARTFNDPLDILMINDENFTNKMSSELELKETVPFKTQVFGFRLNSNRYGLNYASNTLGVLRTLDSDSPLVQESIHQENFSKPIDAGNGKVYRVDAVTGVETIVEERTAI